MALQRSALIEVIRTAFHGVELEEGVSLHQTEVIDNYGSEDEMAAARNRDRERTRDWEKLVDDPALPEVTGIGGISFFDAKGLRFHLPAYLLYYLKDPYADISDSLLFALFHESEYNWERFAILTPGQRAAVRQFIEYVIANDLDDFNRPKLERALRTYWRL